MTALSTRSREAAQRDLAVAALNEIIEATNNGFTGGGTAVNALAKIAEVERTAPPSGWQDLPK